MLSTAQKNLDKDTTQIDEDESVKFQQKTTSKPSHKKSAGNTASNDKDMTA
jgi:hypothetical protein